MSRRGAAVVEAALLTPLLLIVTMGAIEIGQYINVAQTLTNASRVGGRLACRDAVENVSDVEDAVLQYVASSFPRLTTAQVQSAVVVTVHRANGTRLYGNDLGTIETGEQLYVSVSLDFSAVKWGGAIEYWQLELDPVSTFSRRE
jgi:Flp pilus assembly protein TadG